MEALIAILIVGLVASFVLAPLRRSPDAGDDRAEEASLADLEARKQAKYREIRDTELDHAQGKLDAAEFGRQSAELRAEAIEILKAIDRHKRQTGAPDAG
ncbi:MAG: hypothetical protein ACR2K6_03850 [Solirubrobacterales bacterium]